MVVTIVVIALGVMVLSHTAPFPFLFDAAVRNVSIWRVQQPADPRSVYLTFDDGPNPTVTPELLDLLKDKHVRATFFLIDEYLTEATAPIVRRMFAEGHAVGQHSGNRWLILHSEGRLTAELQTAASHIELLTGYRPCSIFRPHAGWRSLPMLRVVSRLHYHLVGWSWLTWDWYWFRRRTGDRVAHQVLAHAGPGKIVVIHDGHHRNPRADRRYAVEATRQIVDGLRAKGYTFATFCGGVSSQSTRPRNSLEDR
jgi:peptidoglycan/xylan/chitin deacetylase (PgdA/CDA1 family)